MIRTATEQYVSDERRDGADGHAFTSTVPLSNVQPGTYVVHVEARTSDGEAPASRDVEVRVY